MKGLETKFNSSLLDSLTDVEWNQMRRIAADLYDKNEFEQDEFKINIKALLLWLEAMNLNDLDAASDSVH